jgi:hypothetical protein
MAETGYPSGSAPQSALSTAEAKPAPKRNPLEQAAANPRSRKVAIKAKCWDCQGGDGDPGVFRRIRECPSSGCPLWPHRPGA